MAATMAGLLLLTFWWLKCYTNHGESVQVPSYVGMGFRQAKRNAQSRNFAGLVPVHWSAVIEEKQEDEPRRFAVDSWFVDNGQPAVILPLEEWKKGAGPDV